MSEKAGVLPTDLSIMALPTKIESYEWNIQVPPPSFDNKVGVGLSLEEHQFTTGSLSKNDKCTASGHFWRKEMLLVVLDMPATDGIFNFRLKPCTIDFMAQGKVVSSRQLELSYSGESHRGTLNLTGQLTDSVDKIRVTFYFEVERVSNQMTAMGKFYNSNVLSDVVICCEDEEFPAHRLVLSMASPVFLGMFQSDTKEKNEGRVVIQDLDKKTVEYLLKWMYFEEVEVPNFNGILDLFKAAHKYCIDPLKTRCASQIAKDHLKLENALEILVLGHIYEENSLMANAKKLIKKGKQQLFKDWDVYQEFLQRYPELMHELFLQ